MPGAAAGDNGHRALKKLGRSRRKTPWVEALIVLLAAAFRPAAASQASPDASTTESRHPNASAPAPPPRFKAAGYPKPPDMPRGYGIAHGEEQRQFLTTTPTRHRGGDGGEWAVKRTWPCVADSMNGAPRSRHERRREGEEGDHAGRHGTGQRQGHRPEQRARPAADEAGRKPPP